MINQLTPQTNPNLKLIKDKYHFVNLSDLLKVAQEHKFGVTALNIRNKYILDSVLEAAFLEKSPLIIEIAESEIGYTNISPAKLAELTRERVAKLIDQYGYMIPLCLHMDHLKKDLSLVDQAIEAGFSSVACDQSKKSLEENIEVTKGVVEKCHPLGVSVEGEIGEIGAAAVLEDPDVHNNLINYVPTVVEAIKFIEETGIDAFAGFFGNGHGKYMDTPVIVWERIKEIVAKLKELNLNTPIVFHGSSYLETHDYDKIQVFVKAIEEGCHKFNYATTVSDIFRAYLPQELDKEMVEAAGGDKNWHKQLGPFEEKIDQIDPKRLHNARTEMYYHIRMMMRHAWGSSEKMELYEESLYSVR